MKKAILTLGTFIIVSALFTSCITMQSATISDVKSAGGTEITTSVGSLGVLGLSVPRNIAQQATNDLKNKGAVGNVSSVMTMRNWGIVQYYRITATGTTEGK